MRFAMLLAFTSSLLISGVALADSCRDLFGIELSQKTKEQNAAVEQIPLDQRQTFFKTMIERGVLFSDIHERAIEMAIANEDADLKKSLGGNTRLDVQKFFETEDGVRIRSSVQKYVRAYYAELYMQAEIELQKKILLNGPSDEALTHQEVYGAFETDLNISEQEIALMKTKLKKLNAAELGGLANALVGVVSRGALFDAAIDRSLEDILLQSKGAGVVRINPQLIANSISFTTMLGAAINMADARIGFAMGQTALIMISHKTGSVRFIGEIISDFTAKISQWNIERRNRAAARRDARTTGLGSD